MLHDRGGDDRGWHAEPGVRRLVASNPLFGNPLKTRDDLQQAVRDLFQPLLPWFSDGKARLQLDTSGVHYGMAASELEAFARPLWGILPLLAGGGAFAHWDLYLEGIANGTDPEHPDYWGATGAVDQRMVEMAVFGLGLMLVPDRFYDPLPPKARANLVRWLSGINDFPPATNNWLFFRVMVNCGLARIGAPNSADRIGEDLEVLESWYLGNGWYMDGTSEHRDYYIPFAMHFYGLLLAQYGGASIAAFASRARERARVFAGQFQHWFASDGAAVPFGRSMTYRFAQGGFWAALAFADEEALPWGRIKSLYLKHLRWWSDQPITSRDGILTIGYAYTNLNVSEQYNAPGSPYWAMKAFLPLALPADHPFWQAEEEEDARDLEDLVSAQPEAGFLARRALGDAVLLSAGQAGAHSRASAPKYHKFAYSSVFGFSIPSDRDDRFEPESGAHDSTLLLSRDGKNWHPRGVTVDQSVEEEVVYGLWKGTFEDGHETFHVTSQLAFWRPGWHLRLHYIRTSCPLWVRETGFSIDRTGDGNGLPPEWCDVSPDRAFVTTPFGVSGIARLPGTTSPKPASGRIVRNWPNTNLCFPRTVMPDLLTELPAGNHVLLTAVYAVRGATGVPDLPADLPAVLQRRLRDDTV